MIQRGDYFLHAHAAGGAQGCYYRRCDTGNHLHDELQGFLLTHNSPPFLVAVRLVIPAGAATIAAGISVVVAAGVTVLGVLDVAAPTAWPLPAPASRTAACHRGRAHRHQLLPD